MPVSIISQLRKTLTETMCSKLHKKKRVSNVGNGEFPVENTGFRIGHSDSSTKTLTADISELE